MVPSRRAARSVGAVAAMVSFHEVAAAEPPPPASYAVPLALSYVALPAMTVGAAVAFSDATDTEGTALALGVGVVGLALPPVVHGLHGQPTRAGFGVLGTLGFTALGAIVGGGIGVIVADCPPQDPNREHDECGLLPVLVGFYTGAGVGYASWAVYDTLANSSSKPKDAVSMTVVPKLHRTTRTLGFDLVGTF